MSKSQFFKTNPPKMIVQTNNENTVNNEIDSIKEDFTYLRNLLVRYDFLFKTEDINTIDETIEGMQIMRKYSKALHEVVSKYRPTEQKYRREVEDRIKKYYEQKRSATESELKRKENERLDNIENSIQKLHSQHESEKVHAETREKENAKKAYSDTIQLGTSINDRLSIFETELVRIIESERQTVYQLKNNSEQLKEQVEQLKEQVEQLKKHTEQLRVQADQSKQTTELLKTQDDQPKRDIEQLKTQDDPSEPLKTQVIERDSIRLETKKNHTMDRHVQQSPNNKKKKYSTSSECQNDLANTSTSAKFTIDDKTWKEYVRLKNTMEKFLTSNEILRHAANKTLKYDLQKAVSFLINSVDYKQDSSVYENLINKIVQLSRGTAECVINSTLTIKPNIHPLQCEYVMYRIAKQIVDRGVVRSHDEDKMAQQFCHIMMCLVKEHGVVFQDIMMANFHKMCIFTIPYYPCKKDNQTHEQHMAYIGYATDRHGNITENAHNYMRRVNGILILYFTWLLRLDKDLLWTWILNILDTAPIKDITAEIIVTFLKYCGIEMKQKYGIQFDELVINELRKNYINRIKATPNNSEASVGRLELALNECFSKNV